MNDGSIEVERMKFPCCEKQGYTLDGEGKIKTKRRDSIARFRLLSRDA